MLDACAAPDHWAEAGREFCRRIDDKIRKRSPGRILPWERKVAVGAIDYFKVHAYALDRLDELLERALPDGDCIDNGSTWRGRHNEQSTWIEVSLLSGAWFDPAARKRGTDLVSLCAHIYRLTSSQAAVRLGQWLGVEAIRHA